MPCRRVFGWGTSRERDREEALSRYLRLLEAVFCGEPGGWYGELQGGILVGTLWKYPKVHHLEIHSKVTWKYPLNQNHHGTSSSFFGQIPSKLGGFSGSYSGGGCAIYRAGEGKLLDLTRSLKMTFWTPTLGRILEDDVLFWKGLIFRGYVGFICCFLGNLNRFWFSFLWRMYEILKLRYSVWVNW